MRKIQLLLLTMAVGTMLSAQNYVQGFSTSKKRMQDSCWVFDNSGINASIGNNRNLVTGNLGTNGSLTSPYFYFNGWQRFSYRSQAAGVVMAVTKKDVNGTVDTLKKLTSTINYVDDSVSISGTYSIQFLFLATSSTGGDRGYIDWIYFDGTYATDSLSCQPYQLLPIELDSNDGAKRVRSSIDAGYEHLTVRGSEVAVSNSDSYTITVYDLAARKLRSVSNQPLTLELGGYIVTAEGVNDDGFPFHETYKVWITE